jgi:hypothetical protein
MPGVVVATWMWLSQLEARADSVGSPTIPAVPRMACRERLPWLILGVAPGSYRPRKFLNELAQWTRRVGPETLASGKASSIASIEVTTRNETDRYPAHGSTPRSLGSIR